MRCQFLKILKSWLNGVRVFKDLGEYRSYVINRERRRIEKRRQRRERDIAFNRAKRNAEHRRDSSEEIDEDVEDDQ